MERPRRVSHQPDDLMSPNQMLNAFQLLPRFKTSFSKAGTLAAHKARKRLCNGRPKLLKALKNLSMISLLTS